MKEHFIKLYQYNDWANKKILEIVSSNENFPEKALKYFSHLLIAEKTWRTRIKDEEIQQNGVWYDIPRNELKDWVNENTAGYFEIINNPPGGNFETKIDYKNTKGVEFSTLLIDILAHVSTHSAYHRGQINAALRNAGIEPVSIDYIIYTRP